jgi:tubulin-folding cofactor B
MLVADVKHKLSTMCGTPSSGMTLQLRDEHSKVLSTLYEDSRPLGYYSPYSG